MDTLSNIALLSTGCTWSEEKTRGRDEGGRTVTHTSIYGQIQGRDNRKLSADQCWCSSSALPAFSLWTHLSDATCEQFSVTVWVFVCTWATKHMSECATCACLRARETILNGTNSLKIHPHTVHLMSMKMQNKKKIKTQLKQQVIHTNQVLWWGGTAIQNSTSVPVGCCRIAFP